MLIALALVVAMQSTTTCSSLGGMTTCNTSAPPPSSFDAYNAAKSAAASRGEPAPVPGAACNPFDFIFASCQVGRERQAQRNEEAARAAEADRALLRQTVTRLLAADDCPAAIRTALDGGDMDLAREARDFCRP